jgi:hypothetical protein
MKKGGLRYLLQCPVKLWSEEDDGEEEIENSYLDSDVNDSQSMSS